jgi:protein-S-isoprenylcysteine O-methyltransferase Ste14
LPNAMNESFFRAALAALVVTFFAVRAYHCSKAIAEGGEIEYKEKNLKLLRAIRLGLGFIFLPAFIAWLIQPRWIAFAALPFPDWLRFAGVALGFANLPVLWWIEATLGKNFNTTLHIREGHTLVTGGPYRWVRHPMYTSVLIFVTAVTLISANALIALPMVVPLPVILILGNRIQREEALMIEQFGDEYREYMKRTGRFLPRLGG